MSLRYVWDIQLRNIFSNIFDRYHRYILSKCCTRDISQGEQFGEIRERKPIQKMAYPRVVFAHWCTRKLLEVYASAYVKIQAFAKHCADTSKKPSYWSKI